MPKSQPDRETLERFVRGELSRRENLKVAWHLFNSKTSREEIEQIHPEGKAVLENLFKGMKPLDVHGTPSYERAFSSGRTTLELRTGARNRDQSRAPKLYNELMRHPISRQPALIKRTWRFKNYVFAEYLIEQSREHRHVDPLRAEDLASLALVVAEQLEGSHYGVALVNDLKARAYANIGNARRIAGDLRSADESFDESMRFLTEGCGDPFLVARISVLRGVLRSEQRRFGEADELLSKGLAIYTEAGEEHWIGRTMIQKALLRHEEGRPEEALEILQQALTMVDAEHEPNAYLAARHNLVVTLIELGKIDEAKKELPKVRKLSAELAEGSDKMRLRWLEGRLAVATGKLGEAEKAFSEMRQHSLDKGLGYDAALASMDLALVLQQRGHSKKMKDLAHEMVQIFRTRDIHREAMAALMIFQKAVIEDSANAEFLAGLQGYLRAARKNPDMQFSAKS